jgi:hypothetical protein
LRAFEPAGEILSELSESKDHRIVFTAAGFEPASFAPEVSVAYATGVFFGYWINVSPPAHFQSFYA